MGCYVNPPGCSKEFWLREFGVVTTEPKITPTHLPVCLVQNAFFTAAGVAYDQRELDAFADPDDIRHKIWYQVPREKLRTASDLVNFERNHPPEAA